MYDTGEKLIIAGVTAGVIAITGAISSLRFIKEGEVGIKTQNGAFVQTVEDAGIHFVAPFGIGRMSKLDIKEKTETFTYDNSNSAVTSDEQDLLGSVTVHYKLNKDQAEYVYKNMGVDYEEQLIKGGDIVDQVFKSETVKYSSADILTHREEIANATKDKLNELLNEKGITVTAFAISQLGFSDQYNQAIEEKQVAEQKKQTAEKNQEIKRIEAETDVITAEKEAEANQKISASLTEQIIELEKIKAELEAIKKWNGELPNVTNGTPFINLDENTLSR